jgi:hypothetical protein
MRRGRLGPAAASRGSERPSFDNGSAWAGFPAAWLPFPRAGRWEEQIDKADAPRPAIEVAQDGQWLPVRVPSNYGCLYLR